MAESDLRSKADTPSEKKQREDRRTTRASRGVSVDLATKKRVMAAYVAGVPVKMIISRFNLCHRTIGLIADEMGVQRRGAKD